MDTQVFRQANFIESAIHNLERRLLEGALIVIVVLFLFLMNWRASFITFLSMPALVRRRHPRHERARRRHQFDDARRTCDRDRRGRRQRHHHGRERRAPAAAAIGRLRASSRGTTDRVVFDAVQEILNSVVYATLIIVLIFLPIFFLEDLAGRIFSPLGVAYIASVTASLVVAVTMVPALCYLLLVRREEKARRCGSAVTRSHSRHRSAGIGRRARHRDPLRAVAQARTSTRMLRFALRSFWWSWSVLSLALVAALALLAVLRPVVPARVSAKATSSSR